jgi:hypothetical protein
MPLAPLQALAPLSPASGPKLHSFQPLVFSLNDPAFSGGGGYGDLSGGYDSYGPTDFTNPFAPATGPGMGGNFPGDGCDPSLDSSCGGCDPSIDPFCSGGGGGIILVSGGGGQVQPIASKPPGSAPKTPGACGSFFSSGWLECWLERLVILALGIAAIVGGIYLLKPSLINEPAKLASKAAVAAAAA